MPSARVERVAEPRQQLPRVARARAPSRVVEVGAIEAPPAASTRVAACLERRGPRELLDVGAGDHELAALAVDVGDRGVRDDHAFESRARCSVMVIS